MTLFSCPGPHKDFPNTTYLSDAEQKSNSKPQGLFEMRDLDTLDVHAAISDKSSPKANNNPGLDVEQVQTTTPPVTLDLVLLRLDALTSTFKEYLAISARRSAG
ncbi:MAG: hypothetical protein Q9225_003287 [Loekoesia sp. 1 TL-2023]